MGVQLNRPCAPDIFYNPGHATGPRTSPSSRIPPWRSEGTRPMGVQLKCLGALQISITSCFPRPLSVALHLFLRRRPLPSHPRLTLVTLSSKMEIYVHAAIRTYTPCSPRSLRPPRIRHLQALSNDPDAGEWHPSRCEAGSESDTFNQKITHGVHEVLPVARALSRFPPAHAPP